MQHLPHGVIPPLVTPFDADRQVDVDSLRRLVDHLLAAGVAAVFTLGSSGEVSFLSDAQRRRVVQTVVDQVNGRVPVLAGAIDTSSARVVDQARLVADAGADFAVVTAPFYAKTQEADVEAHYRAVATRSPVPIVAYDIPVAVTTKLSPDLLMRLGSDGAIVAVKDSSAVQSQLRSLVMKNRAAGRPLSIFTGTEVVADADYQVGVDGMVPGLGNVDPAGYVRLDRLLREGNWDEARSLQDDLVNLFTIIDTDPSLVGPAQAIGAFKEALRLRGVISTSATSTPLTLLSNPAKEQIARIVARHFAPSH